MEINEIQNFSSAKLFVIEQYWRFLLSEYDSNTPLEIMKCWYLDMLNEGIPIDRRIHSMKLLMETMGIFTSPYEKFLKILNREG